MILTNKDLQKLCKKAIIAAKKAGNFIGKNADKAITVQNKSGADSLASQVVTEIDVQAQEIILQSLKKSISDYDLALLTEESVDDKSRFDKDQFWCIDPMDGTLAFTEKTPGYAVSIALVSKAGESLIGVVYNPSTKVLYHAIKGQGAFKNEKPWSPDLSMKNRSSFTLQMDRTFLHHRNYKPVIDEINGFVKEFGIGEFKIQKQAGAVLNACWVIDNAPGCYFKFPKPQAGGGSIWDFAATTCIAKEAGIIVSNFSENYLQLNHPETTFMNSQGVLFASDKEISDRILSLYKKLIY